MRVKGWPAVVEQLRGKSNISSGVRHIQHKALRILQHQRQKKASVWITNTQWSKQRCNNAVHRGSHKSAHRDHELVFKKMANFCTQGYCWAVLPYKVVRSWANLRVSPLRAVPQHNRRPRIRRSILLTMSLYVNFIVSYDTYWVRSHSYFVSCNCDIALIYTHCVKRV